MILLFVSGLACHSEPAEPTDTATEDVLSLLTGVGPYSAGYRESSLDYPDPAGGGDRSLRLAIWYPSADTEGEAPRYYDLFDGEGAFLDADPAPGPFPLVVFSHGHQGFAENSSFLMNHLARHGFVVAAPDHTDNTFLDGSDRSTAIYYQRPLDISAVLDHMFDLQADDPLSGRVEQGPVLAIGHSFGGYTAFALVGARYDLDTLAPACESGSDTSAFCSTWSDEAEALFSGGFRDERVVAALAMAPGDHDLFGASGVAEVGAPVLHMTGDLDGSTPTDGEAYWSALQGGPDRRVQITGATHQAFTDFANVLDPAEGELEAERGFRVIDAYALAWAWRALGDEAGAEVLDGELVVDEAAVLME